MTEDDDYFYFYVNSSDIVFYWHFTNASGSFTSANKHTPTAWGNYYALSVSKATGQITGGKNYFANNTTLDLDYFKSRVKYHNKLYYGRYPGQADGFLFDIPEDDLENEEGDTSWLGSVGQWFVDLGTTIGGFFSDLLTGFKRIFIPEEGFLEGVQDRLTEANDSSDFIWAIRYFMDDIRDFTKQDFTSPPNITVNLNDADSDYNYGTSKVNLLDVSWFAKYRKYTDPFLSAILWFFFFWALAKNLPNILNGSGIITDTPASVVETAYTMKEGKQRTQDANMRREYMDVKGAYYTEKAEYYSRRNKGGK